MKFSIVVVITILITTVLIFLLTIIVCVNVSCLRKDPPPLRFYIFIILASRSRSELMRSLHTTSHDGVSVIVLVVGDRGTAGLLREMDGLSGEKLGGEIAGCVLIICGAALAGFAVLELCMRREEALVVGGTCEGLLASGLRELVLAFGGETDPKVGRENAPDQTWVDGRSSSCLNGGMSVNVARC